MAADDEARGPEGSEAPAMSDMARYTNLPKQYLYVRVGLENEPSSIKQIPRYRLDVGTVNRVFACNVAFLQETKSGMVVYPQHWKEECLPAPALYVIREQQQPQLDPDALEEALYRGSVQVFALDVPDDVDQAGLEAWLVAGLDDDDPELVASKLRIEELEVRLKEIATQLRELPESAIEGASVAEELRIKHERTSRLNSQREEALAMIAVLKDRVRAIAGDPMTGGSESHNFRLRLVETQLPLRLHTWEVSFDDSDRGRRLAYVATHKLNWGEFSLIIHRSGRGIPEVRKGSIGNVPETHKLLNMRGVRVARLQHGQGTFKFADERGFYSGQWVRGVRHGLGLEVNSLGRYTGRFIREWKGGEGTQVYANGDILRGSFGCQPLHEQMSLLHGDEYMDGLPNGQCHVRFVDGSEFVGRFQAGRVQGEGRYTDSYGSVWEGSFGKYGLLQGRGTVVVGDRTESGSWSEGRLHGEGVIVDRALGRHRGQFRDGLPHGRAVTFADPIDARFKGYYAFGLRHGRGVLNCIGVARDEERRKERAERIRAAMAGKSGIERIQAGEQARQQANQELGLRSAADEATNPDSFLGSELDDGVPPASDDSDGSDGGSPGAAARKKANEYEQFHQRSAADFAGEIQYEGRWRASRTRIEGCVTLRNGRTEPHLHTRWPSSSVRSEHLEKVAEMADREADVGASRARTVKNLTKESLGRRLAQEAENLRSFAYWQALASKRLEQYRERTAMLKADLARIKAQLARPDEVLSSLAASRPVGLGTGPRFGRQALGASGGDLQPTFDPVRHGQLADNDGDNAAPRARGAEDSFAVGGSVEGPRLVRDDVEFRDE